MITYSYIGQAPVKLFGVTVYLSPGYEAPEFMEPAMPKPQCYHSHYAERRGKNYAAIVEWLKAHGPATAKVIGIGIGKSDQAVRCSIEWHTEAFVELGEANDSRHSVIYGLVGQTLDDMTVNCTVERLYHRIANYLTEHGEARVPDIAKAVASTDSRVSSCLSSYGIFQTVQIGRHDFVWKLKGAA